MKRALRPRATDNILVAPLTMTDRTCHALAGLDPKPWRSLIVKLGVRHILEGRRMIVLVADYVAALERASSASTPTLAAAPPDDDMPETIDDVLGALNLKRAS